MATCRSILRLKSSCGVGWSLHVDSAAPSGSVLRSPRPGRDPDGPKPDLRGALSLRVAGSSWPNGRTILAQNVLFVSESGLEPKPKVRLCSIRALLFCSR